MNGSSSVANRRVSASSSVTLIELGSQVTPPFGAAERHADQGALPGHPHGQGPDVVDVGVRMEPQPALGRAARHVVLHPVALEHLHGAVVEPDREANGQLAFRHPQDGAQPGLERQVVGRSVELLDRGGERAGAG